MMNKILKELRHHAPFTLFGALTGIVLMALFYKLPHDTAHTVFYVLHPVHVILSALVTAAIFRKHSNKAPVWLLLIIGYVGAVGIATLSDSLIPYLQEILFNMPRAEMHIGFIEQWWLVNPLAILGVAIGYFNPKTYFPHAGHVLLSTWASLFHIIMALGGKLTFIIGLATFAFLFIAVWLPCCVSDIVFPMLFVRTKARS